MKIPKFLIVFLFFPFFVQGSVIENIRFSHLTITDGLPDNTVNCIAQDNLGFIWLGTRNGLSRYDGYEIKNYFSKNNDDQSLNSNFIVALYNDHAGRLWVLNEKGLCRYDQQTDKFRRYKLWKGQRALRRSLLCETRSGDILVTNQEEIYIYDSQKDALRLFLSKSFLSKRAHADFISCMAEDEEGFLWIAANRGVRCYDPKRKCFVSRLPEGALADKIANSRINQISIDRYSRIWFGTEKYGLLIYDPVRKSSVQFSTENGLANNNIGVFTWDNRQNTWIGTEQGVNIIDKSLTRVQHLQQNVSDVSRLSDNAIYSIFIDNAKDVWIGTYFGGVNVFYEGYEVFTIYPYGYSDKHLSGKAVRQIIANDPNSLWIASEDGGLNYLDRRSGEIKHYKSKSDKIPLSYHNVHCLLKDQKNNLWIGTFTGGINCFNLSSGRMKYYYPDPNLNSIFSLVEDHQGIIWAGLTNGLKYYVPKEDRFVSVQYPILKDRFVYCLYVDRAGDLWVGTRIFGLFKLDRKNGKLIRIKTNGKFDNFITSIYQDSRNVMWIGTDSEGVICLDQKGRIKTLSVKDGLPSNAIKAFVEDNEGKLWISTESGLCSYELSSGTRINYTVNDGLPINLFNFNSAYKASDGELFFGTINGMISFYPHLLKPARKIFKVEFTDFKISGKSVHIGDKKAPLKKNISETERIVLTHRQAFSFSFEFSGLNYRYASNAIYAIRLKGADPNWQIVGKQRQILFSNLPEGSYTLQIKASIDGVHWDESGMRTLEIIIRPPFWKSWWAYILYLICILAAGYVTFQIIKTRVQLRMKLQAEHAEKLQLEELNRHKIDFFTFISHDLKTPLTLISSPLQRLIKTEHLSSDIRQKLEVILRNAGRMNHLIDELMTFSKIEMKQMKITVKRGDVLSFIHQMSNIFEMIAVERDIDLIIKIANNKGEMVWFSPSKLERILYNLLSNAFKYTPNGGMITLSAGLSHVEDQVFLNITVEDTGRGIPEPLLEKIFENYYQVERKDEKQGTGVGLALTKVLVNMHKGTIKAESEPGSGTRFIVQLNVSESAFDKDEKSTEFVNPEQVEEYNKNLTDSVLMLSESASQSRKDKNRKRKVLIVEDNPEMNDFLVEIFNASFVVIRAFDGREGYEKVVSEEPDLVISDVMMPVMDGLELTEKLKSDLLYSHIPVILLTAKSMEADFTSGYSSGADAYIVKPFNSENLELLVNNLLQTRQSNIELFNQSQETDIHDIVSNPKDEKFMSDLVELIMKNIDNENWGVSEITSALGVSRSLLHVKLKKLTGASITEFIRQIKMKEARKLLLAGNNVSETSFAVGISDPNYFTKCFKKQMGMTPSEFIKNMKTDN